MGGILGLNLDACAEHSCSSMWQDGQYGVEFISLALSFQGDYDWWYKADKTSLPSSANAEALFAINDPTLVQDRAHLHSKVVLKSSSNDWKYVANAIEFDGEALSLAKVPFQISMGIAGIGLPEKEYMQVARKLYEADKSIICPSSLGGSCHSETYCA